MMRPLNATLDTLIAIAVVSDVIDIHVAILEIYIYLYVLSFRKKAKKLSLGRYPKKYKGENVYLYLIYKLQVHVCIAFDAFQSPAHC